MLKKRLTIMVPALNEEGNLEAAVRGITTGLKSNPVEDYEIIIFDDGSTDNTGVIAEQLAKRNKKIRVIHNRPNRGMGYCYYKGLELAKYEYYMYIPGDNQFPAKALSSLIDKIGQADIVIPYVTNMNIRPVMRQLISKAFTIILNFLFRLKVTYYNAPVIHKTQLLRGVPQKANSGHAYQAEILVKLLRAGASFVEVGYKMYERSAGKTTFFKLTNIKRVVGTLVPLFWQIQISGQPPVAGKTQKILDRTQNIW